MISERLLFATRLSVSVVLAAGLSLWLGWEKPVWAMFAVIYCALGDEGESLHKGQMRAIATLIGGSLSLLFTALFNDHRWAFGGAVLLWIMICAYKMQDNRRYYIWFMSGWLTILMPIYSAEQPALAFEVVMLRLEETLLGLICYTLVAGVLLPDNKRTSFIFQMKDQVAAVRDELGHLAEAYRGNTTPAARKQSAQKLRNEAQALHASFLTRISVRVVENFDVMENRDAWQRAIIELEVLIQMLNRLRLSLEDIHAAPHPQGLPEISAVTAEISRRLDECVAVLGGADEVAPPRPVELPPVAQSGMAGDVFAQGAVLLAMETLGRVERHSADLLTAISEARGLTGPRLKAAGARPALPATIIPDPEKLASVIRVAVVYSAAFLLYVFVPDMPSGQMVILLSTIICLFIAMKPTIPTLPVYLLGNAVIVVAGIIHMMVMPKVSSFLGLGAIIGVYMFIGAALLSSPKVAPLRFLSLGFGAMLLQITNDQSYSFIYVANMLFVFQLPFALVWLTQSFPISFRPERVFQRLLRRYMASFQHLIAQLSHDQRARPRGWWQRQIQGWHLRNLMRVPDQMATWIEVMPQAAMSEDSRAEARALCQSLLDLGARMADYARLGHVQYSPATAAQLRPAIRAWREALQRLGGNFRDAPEALPLADRLTASLRQHLGRVQDDTRSALSLPGAAEDGAPARMLLQELSVYRGMSESLIAATRHAAALDWPRLQETRF